MRKHYRDISESQRVDRTTYVEQIVEIVKAVNLSTQKMRSGEAVNEEEHRQRFIVLKAGAGMGKTVLLQQLEAELEAALREESCVSHVTEIINVKQTINDPDFFRHAMSIVCNETLSESDVSERSHRMGNILSNRSHPVIVLLDDLETLNNPLFRTSSDRDKQVADIKNLFLRRLLRLLHVPVIIIAAIRAMPDEPMQYLCEIEFQDALIEIPIENKDEDVQRVLGEVSTSDKIEECAECLLVADVRGADWDNSTLKQTLVDEIMSHDDPLQRLVIEGMLRELNKLPIFNPREIRSIAGKPELNIPDDLQQRMPARLIAASYLIVQGAKYSIYPPLANLL